LTEIQEGTEANERPERESSFPETETNPECSSQELEASPQEHHRAELPEGRPDVERQQVEGPDDEEGYRRVETPAVAPSSFRT
jgi:hypothetical protein